MSTCLKIFVLLFFLASFESAFAQNADNALRRVDLSSDTAWTLCIDDSKDLRAIRVPGGGYNSDRQSQPLIDGKEVKDHVTYKRVLRIPAFKNGEIVKIRFGSVNHGCDIFLRDSLVGSHVGPHMPFEVDITKYVIPGQNIELKVVSYPQWHYGYRVPHGFVYAESRNADTRGYEQSENGWSTKFGYGITRYVELAIYPEVRIEDVFVQTIVKSKQISYTVTLQNQSDKQRQLTLGSQFSSWNRSGWKYPDIPDTSFVLQPSETKKIVVGPISWEIGDSSYWWPNKPFREDYKAQLHYLNLNLYEGGTSLDKKIQRFGFVEWTEGPNYYLINGVRFNHISDGTPEAGMSEYDCYSNSPAFLPPTDSTKGCPETWKKYMRLGINTNRIHQSTPTEYMMEVADELGFVLVNETAIRGCQQQLWDSVYLPQAVRELAKISRNHSSVCRYSVQNEASPKWVPILIDSLLTEDPTRPVVFEDNQLNKPSKSSGSKGHAFAMLHYVPYPKPASFITGMGEYAWHWPEHAHKEVAEGGLNEFIYYGADMRRWDIAYFAGWDFINYWPNFLEGMSRDKHAWQQSVYKRDRIDGVDGWNSPVTKLQTKYFHPYLVLDVRHHESNKISSSTDLTKWPYTFDTYKSGESIHRTLEIFNDGIKGDQFTLICEARWDSAQGAVVFTKQLKDLVINPGFHKTVQLRIKAPATKNRRKLFFVLRSQLNNEEVFKETELACFIDAR